jgi:phage terminase Nu1 subunit (DNA packaging protein)
MNKQQVSAFFDISMTGLNNWIRRGCPAVHRGSGRADPWIFDALEVAEWRFAGQSRAANNDSPEDYPPNERKAWYESELKRQQLDASMRKLIPIEEVEQVIATSFSAIAQGLQSLPDTVERRTGCDPDLVLEIQKIVESEMDALADKLAIIGPTDEGDADE